ncbi:MAG TPA: ANTAR domain-containing protein [Lapillicoccus sp.]|nr:ANTAR domain-containing protein [Lapillicoccus sp.]
MTQHQSSDPYAVLGVPRDATQPLIDQAYRALVRRYHPDSRPRDGALAETDDTRLADVMAAYLVLGNPERRAVFDRRTPTASAPAQPAPVRHYASYGNGALLVSAGPVHWYQPAPTAPDAPAEARDGHDGHDGAAAGRATPTPRMTHPNHDPDLDPDLDLVDQVRALTAQVSQLTVARDSNRRIGMAMGIIMSQRRVDEAGAFDLLRGTSQNTNRKLRDIAEDVIRDRRA